MGIFWGILLFVLFMGLIRCTIMLNAIQGYGGWSIRHMEDKTFLHWDDDRAFWDLSLWTWKQFARKNGAKL
jgi:hypothetical protein